MQCLYAIFKLNKIVFYFVFSLLFCEKFRIRHSPKEKKTVHTDELTGAINANSKIQNTGILTQLTDSTHTLSLVRAFFLSLSQIKIVNFGSCTKELALFTFWIPVFFIFYHSTYDKLYAYTQRVEYIYFIQPFSRASAFLLFFNLYICSSCSMHIVCLFAVMWLLTFRTFEKC